MRLPKFDKERAITFIPPEGSFDLMTYRITENVNLPFNLLPNIREMTSGDIEATIQVNHFPLKILIKILA